METPPYYRRSEPICRLSDPAQPHTLHRVLSQDLFPNSLCSTCKGEILQDTKYCYYCDTCDLSFHWNCHGFQQEIRHPFHPSHPLTLISLVLEVDSFKLSDSRIYNDGNDDDDRKHEKCKCCRKRLESVYYHCTVCNFSFNASCLTNPPPLTITPPKSHEHTLTLFPRKLPLPCDACGLSLEDRTDHVYACHPCNYMVHEKCIYLPRVIWITRHPHRLSFTSTLSLGDFSCGVCRKTVDVNYGQYSCTKGCHYAIHSKCATREDVWDGKDLEGVPEEPIEDEDIEPFMKIDENTIQHFSHDHYMRLHKNGSLGNQESKFCDACILPIVPSDCFYSCMQCEFVLHEACACLPRKKHHPLHKHPLILLSSPSEVYIFPHDCCVEGVFKCKGCDQLGCGFVYECANDDCAFELDVRCASIQDPIIHGCHRSDHSLFINLTKGECMRCKSIYNSSFFLECVQCESFLCLTCANVPRVTHYKYDSHPLTLCYGEEDAKNHKYWCEICESKLDSKIWFYTCEYCRITLHVTCLLGLNMYMKSLETVKMYNDNEEEVVIARNHGSSRPVCDRCGRRCVDALVFKCSDRNFCTLDCMNATWIAEAVD